MNDERDRFGQKLTELERAREDQWAHQRDQELIEKLREKGEPVLCPQCKKPLARETHSGVVMMGCPDKHGAWLTGPMLGEVLKRIE